MKEKYKMKKKITAVLLSFVFALALFLPAGCGIFPLYEADDSFPYDAAVARGEEGSCESWLASLDTPSTELRRAYEESKADGSFTGTYFEFLKEVGAESSGDKIQSALFSVVNIYAYFQSSNGHYYVVGAGVIYDLDVQEGNALIVTNYHIVYSATSTGKENVAHISDDITLTLYGESKETRPIKAVYVGGAMEYDIAVLRVENCEYLKQSEGAVYARPIVAADSDSVCAGERVYAIGNADGEGMSVTEGVLSVTAEYIDITAADEVTHIESLLVMRTDTAVNHGNSGGGLFNAQGELIGIVNARDESDGIVGFGYALPANISLAIAQNIVDTCAADARNRGAAVPRLGITTQVQDAHSVFDEETGKAYIEQKLVIAEVEYRSAADDAGLHDGDTLISATLASTREGEVRTRTIYLTRLHMLGALLFEARLGDTLTLTVSRDGQLLDVEFHFTDKSNFKLYD